MGKQWEYILTKSELTYMATLAYLVDAGTIEQYYAPLENTEMPERRVYFSHAASSMLQQTLPNELRDRGRNLTPLEQVEQSLYEFIVGQPLTYSVTCRKLDPLGTGIWELKTEDVRLIGWIPERFAFLVNAVVMKKALQKNAHYSPYIRDAVAFRDQLNLNEPKFLGGVNIRDLV